MIRGIFAAFLVILGLAFFWKYFSHVPFNREHVESLVSQSGPSQSLRDEPRSAVVYKLTPKEQELLLQSVDYYCVKKYHRDSCIHHLITCGVPCMVAIPKPRRRTIFADYQKLRAERGLPQLPNVPHGDFDDQ